MCIILNFTGVTIDITEGQVKLSPSIIIKDIYPTSVYMRFNLFLSHAQRNYAFDVITDLADLYQHSMA